MKGILCLPDFLLSVLVICIQEWYWFFVLILCLFIMLKLFISSRRIFQSWTKVNYLGVFASVRQLSQSLYFEVSHCDEQLSFKSFRAQVFLENRFIFIFYLMLVFLKFSYDLLYTLTGKLLHFPNFHGRFFPCFNVVWGKSILIAFI